MLKSRVVLPLAASICLLFGPIEARAEMTPEVEQIQAQWAEINYRLPENQRADAMLELVGECDQLLGIEPVTAEALTWCGIVKSTQAGLSGPFSAMKFAKSARADLERAIELDPKVLSGSAYTSLGTLYYKVPGWPIGFGDKDRARELLGKGLAIDESGIDANYFYGEFLYEEGETDKAKEHLQRAANAPARPGREVADAGRHKEVAELLARIDGE